MCDYYAQMAARINSSLQARMLGERLRTARRSRKLSLKQLGELTGVHHSQISRFEQGEAITFSKNLQKICNELRVGLAMSGTDRSAPLSQRVDALVCAAPTMVEALDAFLTAMEQVVASSPNPRR